MNERQLQMRLKTYRATQDIADQLRAIDRHGLLAATAAIAPEPKSLEDILDLDDDLLIGPGSGIFSFRHARPGAARPDKVSERRACKDFELFKHYSIHAFLN